MVLPLTRGLLRKRSCPVAAGVCPANGSLFKLMDLRIAYIPLSRQKLSPAATYFYSHKTVFFAALMRSCEIQFTLDQEFTFYINLPLLGYTFNPNI